MTARRPGRGGPGPSAPRTGGRRRPTGPRTLLVPLGVVALAAGVLGGCSSSGGSPSADGASAASAGSPSIPLASSTIGATTGSTTTGSTTTWATLAMGHLDDPLNTFWQLVALSAGSAASPWELATPPGVASNGGLVAATGSTAVLAGFEPTKALSFSPLARTADRGSTWAPGILPAGMSPVPEALAESGDGHSLALLRTRGGTVVGNDGDLTTWTPVTRASALASVPGPRGCHLSRLTAVAFDAAGSPLVGASCSRGGQAGIFASTPTGWESVGPGIPGGGSGLTEVIRLVQTPTATGALVVAGEGTDARLVALWSANGLRTWTVSAGLSLGGGVLLSTGSTGSGGFVVAAKGADGSSTASDIAASGTEWQALARLPSGTASVTATPAGGYDALVPRQSTLVVYALAPTGWGRVQSLQVSIQYGSSG